VGGKADQGTDTLIKDASAWLSAIVNDSQDAILSKTLDGIITSWNAGAERLFGFSRAEAIGRPITIIIPQDRLHEEAQIIARLRAGQRVDRMETVRLTKSGEPVNIEVSISPVRDENGVIVGASKIARDIGERLRLAEKQTLLVREMHHRIKNLLSVVQALISVGRKRAHDIDAFADELTSRITALAAAQQLVLRHADGAPHGTTLRDVLETVLAPYGRDRFSCAGSNCAVGEAAVTSLALLLYELATNAAKYGALSIGDGHLSISVEDSGPGVAIRWCETGGNAPDETRHGFGSDLIRAALRGLGGTITRDWDGVHFTTALTLDRTQLSN
jgi:PAS domain S-box-containing protein